MIQKGPFHIVCWHYLAIIDHVVIAKRLRTKHGIMEIVHGCTRKICCSLATNLALCLSIKTLFLNLILILFIINGFLSNVYLSTQHIFSFFFPSCFIINTWFTSTYGVLLAKIMKWTMTFNLDNQMFGSTFLGKCDDMQCTINFIFNERISTSNFQMAINQNQLTI